MNFQAELAEKVMGREKTVTRRLVSDNPRSPWYEGGCSLNVGQTYAVCPGRGKNAIGRVMVADVRGPEPIGWLDDDEARREGFENAMRFHHAFAAINGTHSYDPETRVWRIEFCAPNWP